MTGAGPDYTVELLASEYDALRTQNATLQREVGRLREALDKYGWHKHRCAAIDDNSADMRWPEIACTCGFDAALQLFPGAV